MHPRLCTWRGGLTKCFSFAGSREWPPSPRSARAAASAHASTSQSVAAIREMRRSRQKGDNMRQTIATMNVPPRLLGLHISSGHLSERTSCRGGGGRYCSIKNRLQHLALPVQADIRMQKEPNNPLTSHKACASCGQSHICELISAEMCLHARGSS